MKKKKNMKQDGITLISLVVTIIVMIILAGISIALVFGERGIITKAKEQKVIQTKAEILDQLELQKTNVLNYDTLHTDLWKYIEHIKEEDLGGHKVTEVIKIDDANAEIVIDGKYIYKVAQIENNVVINVEGYIEELDPQIDSFVVKSKTTNKIEVEAKVRRAEKYEFWILKNGNWEKEETEKIDSNDPKPITHKYEKLTQGEKYQLKIVAIRGKKQVEKIIDNEKDIGTLEVANLSITVTEPDKWTKGTKTITITPSNNNYSKIRYTLDGTIPTTSSTEYKEPFTVNKNCTIIALAFDSTNQIGASATNTVTKIDKLAPTVGTQVQYVTQTINSATVKVKVEDKESGLSIIKWYYKPSDQIDYNTAQIDNYTVMNGENAGEKTEQEKSHTFSSLSCGNTYNIYAEVYDVAGNMTRTPETGSVDVEINHVYETKTTTNEYLKSGATCTEVAVYYYKCNGCNEKGTTTYTNGKVLGHNYTSSQNGTKRSDATCTAAATYYDKCTRCGANASTYHNSGNALGHTGNEGGTVTQYPSCTNDGWRWYRCTRCHQDYSGTYKYENAWGHNMGSFYSTSSDKYNHHRKCTRCSYEETEEHSFRFAFPNGRVSTGATVYCGCDEHHWKVTFHTEWWAQFNYDHQNENASPTKDFPNRGVIDWSY